MLTIGSNIAVTKTSIAGIHAFLYVAIQMHHQMILDGSYVGVIMRVAKYTVDCAVALGAPLGFGRATVQKFTLVLLHSAMNSSWVMDCAFSTH